MQPDNLADESNPDGSPTKSRIADKTKTSARMANLNLARALTFHAASVARERAADLMQAILRLRLRERAQQHPRFAIAAAFPAISLSYLVYCLATIPISGGSALAPTPSAVIFEDRDGQPLATRGVLKGDALSADNIPLVLENAVVSIEDRRFYQHGAIDLWAMTRAAWHDLRGGRIEGGSTIAQQLARSLYLSPERTVRRKVQEAMLAYWLELRFSKNEILARYLNTVYFGDGAYGVDSAALRYFGKSARQLSLSEAAMLAGLIRAPSQLEPDRNLPAAQARANTVLAAMAETGAITELEATAAQRHPAVLRIAADTQAASNYFLDTAAAEVKLRAGSSTDDLTVHTTLDAGLQSIAESVIAKQFSAKNTNQNPNQAALVALAPDGAILALVGGRDYNASQFNRVTQARRQTGSLFKAFVYLTALPRMRRPCRL